MKFPKELTVISQKHCSYSMGYDSILKGILDESRKLHIPPRFTTLSIDEIPSVSYTEEFILVLGYTEAWTNALLLHLASQDNTIILLGNTTSLQDIGINTISIDHRQIMQQSIAYLQFCGKTQTAFLGYNRISTSSQKFENAFRSFYPSENLFENYGSIDELCERFLSQHQRFDSVICFIDKIAIVLMNKAKDYNIKIPDQLYVMSFGGTEISRYSTPSLTTVSLSYYKCGCTAVSMVSLLDKPANEPVHITLQSNLCPRSSTANIPFVQEDSPPLISYKENVTQITQDTNLLNIGKLERLFSYCDEIDLQILRKLANNETYEQISETIPIGITTLHYRLSKLLQYADIRDRKELLRLLDFYNVRL